MIILTSPDGVRNTLHGKQDGKVFKIVTAIDLGHFTVVLANSRSIVEHRIRITR